MSIDQWRRLLVLVVLMSLVVPAPSGAREASSAEYAYRARVDEVRLTFVATDQQGRDLSTLTAADFAVVDNESIIRNFRSFGHSPDASLDVVVVVDASGSLGSQLKLELADVLRLISDTNWGHGDTVSVLTFGGTNPSLICARNCSSALLAGQLSRLHADGQTPLFDAMILATETASWRHDPQVRPVLIVFSDGEDNYSRYSDTAVIEAAQRIDARIYTVDAANSGGRESSVLREMAEATGGRAFSLQQNTRTLASVLEDLRSAYVVSYLLPDHSERVHSVRVLPTHNLNLRFRCRSTYYDDDSVPRSRRVQ